jgi:poly(3-hydroxybutyrate) depolymerase
MPRTRPAAVLLAALFTLLYGAGLAPAQQRLGRYPADPAKVSISGISSGAFMASQLHIAHSAGIIGAGLVAGGLYGCAVDSVARDGVQALASKAVDDCMRVPSRLLPAADYATRIRQFAAAGWIDPVAGLAHARLYAFTGRADSVVNPLTVERAVAVYEALGLPAIATSFSDKNVDAGHSWVTSGFGGACDANAPPYIDNCGYDQAGEVLKAIYQVPLKPRTMPGGDFIVFDQREFAPGGDPAPHGLWDVGALYVPPACQAGASCWLHVVLHGCEQSMQALSPPDTFYRHIGMNEWADNNLILILYPQARTVEAKDFPNPRPTDLFSTNPKGCWNWWGYGYDNRYLFKDGRQIAAIWRMIQRVTGQSNQ